MYNINESPDVVKFCHYARWLKKFLIAPKLEHLHVFKCNISLSPLQLQNTIFNKFFGTKSFLLETGIRLLLLRYCTQQSGCTAFPNHNIISVNIFQKLQFSLSNYNKYCKITIPTFLSVQYSVVTFCVQVSRGHHFL